LILLLFLQTLELTQLLSAPWLDFVFPWISHQAAEKKLQKHSTYVELVERGNNLFRLSKIATGLNDLEKFFDKILKQKKRHHYVVSRFFFRSKSSNTTNKFIGNWEYDF
jgi:hypothetical protein